MVFKIEVGLSTKEAVRVHQKMGRSTSEAVRVPEKMGRSIQSKIGHSTNEAASRGGRGQGGMPTIEVILVLGSQRRGQRLSQTPRGGG